MIELPESHVLARQFEQSIKGFTISEVVVGQSPHGFAFFTGDTPLYSSMLCGKALDAAYALAGQVELSFGDARLALHDGVNPRLIAKDAPRPKKHQLLLEFEEGCAVACTVQMYGGMSAFIEGTNQNPYYLVAKNSPSPYGDAFTWEHFSGIAQAAPPKLSAKGLLATEQRIPGLGNGCLQDILFAARVNPQSRLGALDGDDLRRMYDSTMTTLMKMLKGGGRDTEKDLFGQWGGYATVLSSKTLAFPCPVCGGAITRKAYMGGNVYFCETCQPVKK